VGGMKSVVWAAMDQKIIDHAVAPWCQHLRAWVQAEEGNFERLL